MVDGSNGLLLEVDGQIVPNYDATFRPIEEGEVVTGHVVRIDKDEVLVDIGYKSEGVIPANELSIRKAVDPNEEVHLGEEVDAIVMTKEDQDGRLIMSKKRARFEKAWRRIETAAESGEPVEGTVIEVVKGGLIIDLGVRGFLPASLVDIRRVPNLDEYMGTKIETKVIELNRSRNNVVLSRRAVLEEERKEVRQQILDRLQPGLVVEGLVHISELAPHHVESPREVVHPGDEIRVRILEIDSERRRLSLSAKRVEDQILPISRPGEPAREAVAEAGEEEPSGEGEAVAEVVQAAEAEAVEELTEAIEVADVVEAAVEAEAVEELLDAAEVAEEVAEIAEAEQVAEAPEAVAAPELAQGEQDTAAAEQDAATAEADGDAPTAESAQQD